MDSNEQYATKWKDPRWQQKRLLIMERDGWTCQRCGDKETTLSVHHRYYIADTDPWDYPDDSLVTLCEHCHESETEAWPNAIAHLTKAVKSKMWAAECDGIAKAIEGMKPTRPTNDDIVDLVMLIFEACHGSKERRAIIDFICTQEEKIRKWVEATRDRLSDGYFKRRR